MILKLLQGLKKIVQKFHGDPTFRYRVINEKQRYAAIKYIVGTMHYIRAWQFKQKKIDTSLQYT